MNRNTSKVWQKKHVTIQGKQHVPIRYLPKGITRKDRKKQIQALRKSRRQYKQHMYYERPKIASFHSKPSKHVERAKELYKIKGSLLPTAELSRKTGCTKKGLQQIIRKGEGAYYSSGSRPNQTAQSWGIARLGSAITGANASIVDYHILEKECKPNSKALKLAKRV